jgi:asparagine synthase (glutamine-hydrolysing)
MCGIAGCVLPAGGRPSIERLAAMRDALAHRGPDGSGIEILGNVGLVHTRLAIVDVSERAHQPMRHPNGQWWISFNGEIFNHQAIRSELAGEPFTSDGDTETLLHALARWGTDVLPRLNGQFAFAAVDLTARRMLLARDRFGIKPLYFVWSDDGFWFASEPAALLAAGIEPSARADIWPSLVDWSCYSEEATLLAGVRRMPPGSWIEIALDTSTLTTHQWDSAARHVDPERQRQLQTRPRQALVSELEGTLRTAVHDALLSDVPVGTLCSGGVDSSLITALAMEVKSDLVAFGARYKGDRALDEGPAVQRVADSLGIELELLEVTKPGWRSGFVEATLHFGDPLATASSVTIAQMAERARRRGIKVLLTGEGADELFAGYAAIQAGPLASYLSPTQRATRRAERVVLGHPLGTLRSVAGRLKRLARTRAPADMVEPDGADPESGKPESSEAALSETEAAYLNHPGPTGALERSLLSNLDFTLSHLLNRMDKNMMQVSVEARVPFLDPRVVELALNLPLDARVGPWSKGILRDVARRVLPWRIAHRPKIYGMEYDAGAWIEDAADPRFLSHGMFREVFAIPTQTFDEALSEARGSWRVRLWSAEVWCRSVFAGESAQTIEKELWPQGP